MFPRQFYLALLGLAGCGLTVQKSRSRLTGGPCERLNVQVGQWDDLNTRTLMACLVNDSAWSQKVEALDSSQFTATTAWLNDREKLFKVASEFQKLHRDWGPLFQNPKTHTALSYTNLQSVLGFSQAVNEQWKEHFQKNQKDYQSLLEKIFELKLSRAEEVTLLDSVGIVFRELPVDQPDANHWAEDLWKFMEVLEKKPAIVNALARVAPHNRCTNLREPDRFAVRTTSPLELGVFLFRDPDITPEAFVETFEQGFLFWQSVCGGDPHIAKSTVKELLGFALDDFDLLKNVAALPWSQESILALGRILEIDGLARKRGTKSGEASPGILDSLLNSGGLKELFFELQKDPARAARLVKNTPKDSVSFEVFAELAADPKFGSARLFSLWMRDLDLLSALADNPAVISEWQSVLKILGPEATRGFGDAIESGKFQERMKYLLYLMNLKQKGSVPAEMAVAPSSPPRVENTKVPPAPHPIRFQFESARRLVDDCLQDSLSIADELACLKAGGSRVFPASARWLPYFTSDWDVLYQLRNFPMPFLLSPKTATEFWQPMIDGLHLPFANAAGFIQWLADGNRLSSADQKIVTLLGRKLFFALSQTPASKNLPSAKRLHKPDPAYFKVQSLLKNLDTKYFSRMIYSLVGDPRYLETRRSFYRLSRTQVSVNGSGQMPMLAALNELIGNFKLPFMSRTKSLTLALSSAGNLKSADDLQKWMTDTEKTLSRADWWMSFVYNSNEEPRKSIRLAQDILHALKAHADPKDLWNVFAWIRDFRMKGEWNQENLSFLMMLHEMGFLQTLQDLYDNPPKWLVQGIESSSPQNAQALQGVSSWISETLLALFQGMSDQELYDFAVLNLEATSGKFLSWTMIELGELIVNPAFSLSQDGKNWLLSGIKQIGSPPLKSPATITPLIQFIRDHRLEFEKVLQPEILQLAAELRQWKAYPELVDFLTSKQRVSEWFELVEWLKSPIPLRLWNWSLRLERRSLDPLATEIPLK